MKPYGVFLAGPWERFATVPYKTLIEEALPELQFFDPEVRDSQRTQSWFEDNYIGMKNSEVMVVFVPEFPFPMCAQEAAMFYMMNKEWNQVGPLRNLIYIWLPETAEGRDWGKEGCLRMGVVVSSVQEAILAIVMALSPERKKLCGLPMSQVPSTQRQKKG